MADRVLRMAKPLPMSEKFLPELSWLPIRPSAMPLPAQEEACVTDWRSASLAYTRSRNTHFLKGWIEADILECGVVVARITPNGRVWSPEPYPDAALLYETTMQDRVEAGVFVQTDDGVWHCRDALL